MNYKLILCFGLIFDFVSCFSEYMNILLHIRYNIVSSESVTIKVFGPMYQSYCLFFTNQEIRCWVMVDKDVFYQVQPIILVMVQGGMGDNLPSLNFGTGFIVEEVSFGAFHSCVISITNQVKCWGSGGAGQLGNGKVVDIGDSSDEIGDNFPSINVGTDSTPNHVYAAGGHTCIHFINDKIKCFGSTFTSAHGQGSTTQYGGSSDKIGDNIPYINLGSGRTVKSLHTTFVAYTTCAILDNDDVKCFGRNDFGQLGIGDTTNRGSSSTDMGDNLPKVDLDCSGRNALSLSVGINSVCAFLNTDEVVCWVEKEKMDNYHSDQQLILVIVVMKWD